MMLVALMQNRLSDVLGVACLEGANNVCARHLGNGFTHLVVERLEG